MRPTRLVSALALAGSICLAPASAARAQTDDRPAPGAWYRLTRDAEFTRGCYDPCDCLIFTTPDFRGMFRLVRLETDSAHPAFAVEGVRMLARFQDERFFLSGRGVYQLGASGDERLNAMTLRLSLSGEPVETFESGVVPIGAEFPRIDITLSMNEMVCFDTVLRISARPVRMLADVNADDQVDTRDIATILAAWGTDHADCDVNADGVVNAQDLAQVLTEWGQ